MPKIIIVEDDPMISEIYQKKFTESGFEVLAAVSGEEVLSLAKKQKVDIVLLDLVMPKMDGFEVIENLRKEQYDSTIRIVAFSNLSQKEDREKAMKFGADAYIIKSDYAPSGLVSEIQRLIHQWEEERKNEVRISNDISPKNEPDQKISGNSKPKRRILMIEDEKVFLDMFGEKLRTDGYEVTAVENGAWGLKEALKGGYDLFIIDMVMPAMMGDELIAKLKFDDKTKNTPIIVFSASVDADIQKKTEAMGVNAFYIKTQLVPSELSEKVKNLIG